MKKYLLFIIFVFLINPVQASLITTDLPSFVLFNFQNDTEGQLGVPYDSTLGSDYQITDVVASAVSAQPTAWLDGPLMSGAPGGLGVCKVGACPGEGLDDVLNDNEAVELTYEGVQDIFVGNIYFRNAAHEKDFMGGDFGISINNGAVMLYSLVFEFDLLAGTILESGDTIQFFWGEDSGGIGEDYLIAGWGVVPIPAALPLFLSGLLGFAFFSRRKAKTA